MFCLVHRTSYPNLNVHNGILFGFQICNLHTNNIIFVVKSKSFFSPIGTFIIRYLSNRNSKLTIYPLNIAFLLNFIMSHIKQNIVLEKKKKQLFNMHLIVSKSEKKSNLVSGLTVGKFGL
jgi:hypothetical protein